jgi:hypothetical protein
MEKSVEMVFEEDGFAVQCLEEVEDAVASLYRQVAELKGRLVCRKKVVR